MKLNKLVELKRKLTSQDQLLQFVKIKKIIEHFNLANSSYEVYKEYRDKWVKDDKKEYKNKSIAALLGLYFSGRVCLYITQQINKEIDTEEINKIRLKYKEWVKRFIDFRNDFGSHSLNAKAEYYSEIAMFGNLIPNLEVETRNFHTYNIIKSYEVIPLADIETLFNYLEELADVYEKCWTKKI